MSYVYYNNYGPYAALVVALLGFILYKVYVRYKFGNSEISNVKEEDSQNGENNEVESDKKNSSCGPGGWSTGGLRYRVKLDENWVLTI